MYALIDISNQMLEDSAFDHAGASLRKAGLAINEMLKRRSVAEWLRRGPVAGCEMRVADEDQAAGAEQASAWRPTPRRAGGMVPSCGHRRSGAFAAEVGGFE